MSKVKTEKKTKKEPRAKAQKKAYSLFRKAPKVPAFLTMIASIGTLALLLLFQMGLLFDWGLTALTSNNVVMAITVTLSVIGFVSVVNVVLAFTTDADNEERVKKFLSAYQGLEGREVKAENDIACDLSLQPQQDDMEADLNVPNDDTGYEQNLTPVDQEAKEDDDPVNMADVLYEDPAEPVAVDDLLNGAEDDTVDPAQETTDSDAQPVDDLGDSVPAETEEQEPMTEEDMLREKQVETFETRIMSALRKAEIPQDMYAIEENKEGAICLTHDRNGYSIYQCKDGDKNESEQYPIKDERAVMQRFFLRITEMVKQAQPENA